MTYLINKWNSGEGNVTSCIYRTNDLEAWLKAIADAKKKYNITKDKCRWQESGIDNDKIVVFSFYTSLTSKYPWRDNQYMKKPNFIFMGFPEGVKYYE